jgi:hypothetical protein
MNGETIVRKRESERGAALLVTLAMLLSLGFVGAALITTAGVELKVAGSDRRGTQAQFAAEGGVQEAIHRLSLRSGTPITVNGLTFDPAIQDTNDPLDPNWQVQIYAPSDGTPTSMDPSVVFSPTVQEESAGLDYMRNGNMLTIRHKFWDLDWDDQPDPGEIVLYDTSKFPAENLQTGSPVEVIEVAGFRNDARRRVRVEVVRYPLAPNVYCAMLSRGEVDVSGNISICGQNHDPNTPVGTDLESAIPCSPNYDEADGHLTGIATPGQAISTSGSSNILGTPVPADDSPTNPWTTLAQAIGVEQEFVDRLLENPDHTSVAGAGPFDGITYIDGNATGGDGLDNVGTGLLYVTGDLDIGGNAEWHGLIYAEGNVRVTGKPWIIGGLIVGGTETPAFGAGDATILYSRSVIKSTIETALDYIILSWREI